MLYTVGMALKTWISAVSPTNQHWVLFAFPICVFSFPQLIWSRCLSWILWNTWRPWNVWLSVWKTVSTSARPISWWSPVLTSPLDADKERTSREFQCTSLPSSFSLLNSIPKTTEWGWRLESSLNCVYERFALLYRRVVLKKRGQAWKMEI